MKNAAIILITNPLLAMQKDNAKDENMIDLETEVKQIRPTLIDDENNNEANSRGFNPFSIFKGKKNPTQILDQGSFQLGTQQTQMGGGQRGQQPPVAGSKHKQSVIGNFFESFFDAFLGIKPDYKNHKPTQELNRRRPPPPFQGQYDGNPGQAGGRPPPPFQGQYGGNPGQAGGRPPSPFQGQYDGNPGQTGGRPPPPFQGQYDGNPGQAGGRPGQIGNPVFGKPGQGGNQGAPGSHYPGGVNPQWNNHNWSNNNGIWVHTSSNGNNDVSKNLDLDPESVHLVFKRSQGHAAASDEELDQLYAKMDSR